MSEWWERMTPGGVTYCRGFQTHPDLPGIIVAEWCEWPPVSIWCDWPQNAPKPPPTRR